MTLCLCTNQNDTITAQQEIDYLNDEIDCLKRENERLRNKLEYYMDD